MLFFVMAASIMAVCIIAIHGIAKYLGRELPVSSLVLCGVSAMCINFLIISVTPFLTKAYYYILGTMIVFAATGTTCYNRYLLYRKARLAIVAVPQGEPEDSVPSSAVVHKVLPIEPDEAVPDLPPEEPPIKAKAVLPDAEPEPEVNHLVLFESMKTLDDILDFAFAQVSTQPQTAIQAYKFALERYRSDEYAPFIVIDMVNLYQAQQQYQEAMDCICQAMELPAIQDNPATRQNFQSYLSQIQALYDSKESR